MRLCFLADARSPIARNWILHFIAGGHEVHVISSYPCAADAVPGAHLTLEPLALAGVFARAEADGASAPKGRPRGLPGLARALGSGPLGSLVTAVRWWVTPLLAPRHVPAVREILARTAPDVVHAMRIPFEGIVAAAAAPPGVPLVVSVWGNDFTLIAARNPLLRRLTRQTLARADALHTDCARDLRLAHESGFARDKPARVLPSGGGVQAEVFHPGPPSPALRREIVLPEGARVVIQPRGIREYVCNEAFFRAIPRVLAAEPEAFFVCPAMAGNAAFESLVSRLGVGARVRLLPLLPRERMADLFRLGEVTVSPTRHDGTPNTLLEAMACGCFPVAGDIESVREWIEDGKNGLLVDPDDPQALAEAMVRALGDPGLRDRARTHNLGRIAERAEHGTVMAAAEQLYREVTRG